MPGFLEGIGIFDTGMVEEDVVLWMQAHGFRVLNSLCDGPVESFKLLTEHGVAFWTFIEVMKELQSFGWVSREARSEEKGGVMYFWSLTPAGSTSVCVKRKSLISNVEVLSTLDPPLHSTSGAKDGRRYHNLKILCEPKHDLYCNPPENLLLQRVLNDMQSSELFVARVKPHHGCMDGQSMVRRLAIMNGQNDLRGSKLAVFGDDNRLSIAAALTGLPSSIVVFEGDPILVEHLRGEGANAGLSEPYITFVEYDVRQTLPAKYEGRFDTVVTDSVGSLVGIGTTLNRMTQAMAGPGSAGYFGSAHMEVSHRTLHSTLSLLAAMQHVVTMMVPNVATYSGWSERDDVSKMAWGVLGIQSILHYPSESFYKSRLVRFESVRTPEPLTKAPIPAEKSVFTEGTDLAQEHSFYGSQIRTGVEQMVPSIYHEEKLRGDDIHVTPNKYNNEIFSIYGRLDHHEVFGLSDPQLQDVIFSLDLHVRDGICVYLMELTTKHVAAGNINYLHFKHIPAKKSPLCLKAFQLFLQRVGHPSLQLKGLAFEQNALSDQDVKDLLVPNLSGSHGLSYFSLGGNQLAQKPRALPSLGTALMLSEKMNGATCLSHAAEDKSCDASLGNNKQMEYFHMELNVSNYTGRELYMGKHVLSSLARNVSLPCYTYNASALTFNTAILPSKNAKRKGRKEYIKKDNIVIQGAMLEGVHMEESARDLLAELANSSRDLPQLNDLGHKPLHPDIYSLNTKTKVHPNLYDSNGSFQYTEVAEQVYMISLFSEEFAKKLIDECEHIDAWDYKYKKVATDDHSQDSLIVIDEPDVTIHLNDMGMSHWWKSFVKKHLLLLIHQLWDPFYVQLVDSAYVLKYESHGGVTKMDVHQDDETVSLVMYLNAPPEYEGGGTHFPKWNYTAYPPHPGAAILYPGGISHAHAGVPITAGKRFLFLAAFY